MWICALRALQKKSRKVISKVHYDNVRTCKVVPANWVHRMDMFWQIALELCVHLQQNAMYLHKVHWGNVCTSQVFFQQIGCKMTCNSEVNWDCVFTSTVFPVNHAHHII